jgi:hypothetical protein
VNGPLAAIDRFVLPAGEPAMARYLHERLLAPHNLRERLRRSAALAFPSLAPKLAGKAPEPLPALETVATALRETGILERLPAAGRPLGWILVEDYEMERRERLVLFLFIAGAASPAAVLKLRRAGGPGRPLAHEHEALRFLAGRLPAELRPTVPRPLAFEVFAGLEALLATALPGVSAYIEMQGLLAPGRAVERHFEAAARWLGRFHRALPGASHGDFWARNLLLTRVNGAAVVDWEHFAEQAPAGSDLGHFPLTYALNYPWRRWRRLPPEKAFRRGFVEENRVSRAVARYFETYAAAAGLAAGAPRRLFHEHLEARAAGGPGGPVDLPWDAFRQILGRAGRSAFSG